MTSCLPARFCCCGLVDAMSPRPSIWDNERRSLLRVERDAVFSDLHGFTRADADYILETLPIAGRRDESGHVECPTKNRILATPPKPASPTIPCLTPISARAARGTASIR